MDVQGALQERRLVNGEAEVSTPEVSRSKASRGVFGKETEIGRDLEPNNFSLHLYEDPKKNWRNPSPVLQYSKHVSTFMELQMLS